MTGLLMAATLASAPLARGVGLGFIVGDPTGFDVKFWNGNGVSPVLAAGMGDGASQFHFHGDINLHYPIEAQSVNFLLYYGVGVKAEEKPHDDFTFGPRMPIGFELLLREVPLDFFVEMAPTLQFAYEPIFQLEGGLGMRVTIK